MSKSCSSELTDQSKADQKVLELGRKIVQELKLDPGVDTLGRWMAHHLAELISEAESADRQKNPEAHDRCAQLIMKLWEHRSAWPAGARPFSDGETILRTLEELSLDNGFPRYFYRQRQEALEEKENSEVKEWLDLIDSLDSSTRSLIRYCLVQAANEAWDKTREWVRVAKEAEAHEGVEHFVYRFIRAEQDILEGGGDASVEERKDELERRLKEFDGLIEMSRGLIAQINSELDVLDG